MNAAFLYSCNNLCSHELKPMWHVPSGGCTKSTVCKTTGCGTNYLTCGGKMLPKSKCYSFTPCHRGNNKVLFSYLAQERAQHFTGFMASVAPVVLLGIICHKYSFFLYFFIDACIFCHNSTTICSLIMAGYILNYYLFYSRPSLSGHSQQKPPSLIRPY